MTKSDQKFRDTCAIAAMQGMLSSMERAFTFEEVAKGAYRLADEMLLQRKKKSK